MIAYYLENICRRFALGHNVAVSIFPGRLVTFAQTARSHRRHGSRRAAIKPSERPACRAFLVMRGFVGNVGEGVMSGESLLVILVVGLIAGWLAGQIVQGTGFGMVGDLVIGIIGAFIGGGLVAPLRHQL